MKAVSVRWLLLCQRSLKLEASHPFCLWRFQLSLFEKGSLVWMTSAVSHLRLLDRLVSKEVCDLDHKIRLSALCNFWKICDNHGHALQKALPWVHIPLRLTHQGAPAHSRYLDFPSNFEHFTSCFTSESASGFRSFTRVIFVWSVFLFLTVDHNISYFSYFQFFTCQFQGQILLYRFSFGNYFTFLPM